MPAALRALGQKPKPEIKIALSGDQDRTSKTYSTFDKIEGSVTITASHDTNFDDIEIDFLGI